MVSVQIIAPRIFQKINVLFGTFIMPTIGFIKVLTNGINLASTSALPIPYLPSHFSVCSTRAWVKNLPSGLSNNLRPYFAPIQRPTKEPVIAAIGAPINNGATGNWLPFKRAAPVPEAATPATNKVNHQEMPNQLVIQFQQIKYPRCQANQDR